MTNATNLIDDLLSRALSLNASDIHLEPHKDRLKIRFRVDGLLQEAATLDRSIHAQAISRIKIMSNIDIAELRLPQDGKAHLRIGESDLDLRVSTMPTINGEKAVIRILHRNMPLRPVEELGMCGRQLSVFNSMVNRTSGIVIATGPTGCGKTTTLYAALNRINSHSINVVTIEDPVEYELGGVNQVQVNNKAGLTFARALRSILRQDPDVIMVGEIRDEETARIAVQAAMTGHLVLSTMHTSDAAGAVSRLIDLGIEPFLVSSTLTGIIAQRLIRLVCKDCGGKRCGSCGQTGYKGRSGIFELLAASQSIKELIDRRAPESSIREEAKKAGMKSLLESGEEKVKAGLTTKQEVFRAALS